MKKENNKVNDKITTEKDLSGLEQCFKGVDGKVYKLKNVLEQSDWWVLKKRKSETTILFHSAVQKIANLAGMQTNPRYSVLISPSHENNHTIAMQIEICDTKGRCTTNIGEVNKDNLGSRGRANPVNMAQKRAYDRAVFTHLGITGLLGEDELTDEEENKEMDKLKLEEQKAIVPFINSILAALTDADLKKVAKDIKASTTILSAEQLDVLRGIWKKKAAELIKSF
jgi:hypothetical protein